MNNVRSYVRGENLWAKAQNGAVTELYKYIYTKDHTHLDKFHKLLSVNLGDKKARQALQSETPDKRLAREGFIEGLNHPDDIPGMITFFIQFKDFYYLNKAIQIWADADELILELIDLATALESAVQLEQIHRIDILVTRLDNLDLRLREKELQFSATLGDGARWIKSTLIIANLSLFVVLLLLAAFIVRKVARRLSISEQELRISDNRFMSLFGSRLIGIFEFNTDGKILDANETFLNMLGYEKSQLGSSDLNWQTLTPRECQNVDRIALAEINTKGVCTPYDKKFYHAMGYLVPVYIGGVLLNGETETGLALVIDQTEKHRMEQELRLSGIVMEHSQDGIVILDEHQKIITANRSFCELALCSVKNLNGQSFQITHERMDEETRLGITQALRFKENWEGDIDFQTTRGNLIPVRLSISIVHSENQAYGQYVLMLTDIKTRKAAEQRLHQLANYDTLTGIANRAMLQSRLHQAIARAKRHQNECALLFIDLNKFKPVNDRYGHEFGDCLLFQVADRLKNLMREIDIVARLGGDEFVVIVEDIEQIHIVEDVAARIVEAIGKPYTINETEIHISCSIGISLYPHDGKDDIELTRAADIAMYAAKSSGEGKYYFFNRRLTD